MFLRNETHYCPTVLTALGGGVLTSSLLTAGSSYSRLSRHIFIHSGLIFQSNPPISMELCIVESQAAIWHAACQLDWKPSEMLLPVKFFFGNNEWALLVSGVWSPPHLPRCLSRLKEKPSDDNQLQSTHRVTESHWVSLCRENAGYFWKPIESLFWACEWCQCSDGHVPDLFK